MNKISTIQKHGKSEIYPDPQDAGIGGAYYGYIVMRLSEDEFVEAATIQFKKADRPGVTESDLLEIVRDRLRTFQRSERACRENACAITHIEEALMWLNKRAEEKGEKEKEKGKKHELYLAAVTKLDHLAERIGK